MNQVPAGLLLSLLAIALACGGAAARPPLPGRELNLELKAPISTWDEAVPLGNGLLGGLLWGEGGTIRLSLDRGDLWDLRTPPEIHEKGFTYANLQRLVRERNVAEIARLTDDPYGNPTPTKIPAGRLEIDLGPSRKLDRFELSLATAEGRAWLADGSKVETFFSATQPVALLRVPGPEPPAIRVRVSGGGGDTGPDSHAVAALGYPVAKQGGEGTARWFVQATKESLTYCVFAQWKRVGAGTLIAITVSSTGDGPDPVAIARKRTSDALARGYEGMLKEHAKWWAGFWEKSAVRLPDLDVLKHYYLVRYFYGAASRLGAPPMPLQGVWTADAGSLPPWKGDYHNDLNTQMTYMGYQAAGQFDEGRCFLEFNWKLLPAYRRFAREFFGTPGASVPGVMSLDGAPLTGWAQYSLSPTMGAWIGHLFYLHWRYTGEDRFLRTRAYPWCKEVGESIRTLLKPDAAGRLVLPLSSSPEVYDNSLAAWLTPNTNFDLACMKTLFLALREMALACEKPAEALEWEETAAKLGPLHVDPNGVLMLDSKLEMPSSHRHLSNLMSLYPFNLITADGGAGDARMIQASLDQWDKLGTGAWCGYSFSWMAALRARVGDGEAARRFLDTYVHAFTLRNGFHCNGDQSGKGYSGFTYRPFTLEGNMLAAAAVHEMLLQSWSATPGKPDGEVIRIFPAMPSDWREASFEDLRAEGAWRVSARREGGATTWFRVVAGRAGVLRIRDNFGGRVPAWSRSDMKKVGRDFVVSLEKGEAVEGRLRKP